MKENRKGQFIFTEDTYGLPDSVVLGENGKPQEHVLRQALGLTRNQGVVLKKGLAKNKVRGVSSSLKTQFVAPRLTLINLNADPGFRKSLVSETAKNLLQGSLTKPESKAVQLPQKKSGFLLGCWDLIVLHDFAPDLWELSSPMETSGEGATDDSSLEDNLTEKVSQIVSTISDRATKEFKAWEKFPAAKRTKLAEVIFAIGHCLDMRILNEAIADRPELLSYYTLIVQNEFNQTLCESGGEEKTESDSLVNEVDNTPEEIYLKIEHLLLQAQKAPHDSSYATDLVRLANEVNDWFEKNPQLTPLPECVELFVSTLYLMGKDSGVNDFSDEQFPEIFSSNWNEYIQSPTVEGVSEDHLLNHLNSGEEVVNQQSNNLEELAKELVTLRGRLIALSECEPTKRSERRQIEDESDEIQTQIQERKNRRREVVDEVLVSLLPPGSNLDEYETTQVVEIPKETDVPAAMQVALDRVFQYLKSGDIPDSPDIDNENETEPADLTGSSADDLETAWAQSGSTDNDVFDQEPMLEGEQFESTETSLLKELPEAEVIEASKYKEDLSAQEFETDPADSVEIEEEWVGGASKKDNDESLYSTCLKQLNENGVIEDEFINRALISFVEKERLQLAISFAELVERNKFGVNTLPSELLCSAFYGQNSWGFGWALSQSRKILATFTPSLVDEWLELREAGKAVPFLIFVSSFKPALMGGNYSNAPSLLAAVKPFFDGPTARLIDDIVALANKNKLIDLDSLRNSEGKASQSEINCGNQVESWAQRIKSTKRGYAPILKAQTYSIEKGVFKDVIDIIRRNDQQRLEVVEKFANKYSDRDSADDLLDELIAATGQDIPTGTILVQGRNRFFHKVSELVAIAQTWIGKSSENSDETDEFCRRFSTLLPQVIRSFRKISQDQNQAEDRQAGAGLVASYLSDLKKVIDGNESSIWENDRVLAWKESPQEFVRTEGIDKDPTMELSWHLAKVDDPLDISDMLEIATKRSNYSLAYLMYLYLRDSGDDRKKIGEELKASVVKYRSQTRRTLTQLENQIDSAVLSLLIKPERGEVLSGEIEEIHESIDSLQKYSSMLGIKDQIRIIREEIARKTANKLKELEDTYRSESEQFQASINEPIPEEWVQTMESSIAAANLPVIDEMLDEIQTARREGQPIRFSPIEQSQIVQKFLACEDKVFSGIKKFGDNKSIWNEICNSRERGFGLDFGNKCPSLKKVVESFYSWEQKRHRTELNSALYEKVVSVLDLIGLETVDRVFRRNKRADYSYVHDEGFVSLYIKVKKADSRRPFPVFGQASVIPQPIIIATKEWSPEKLESYIQNIGIMGSNPILISGVPLANHQRNQFASYFKSSKSTIFHIDLVAALFLSCLDRNSADKSAIRNFLWLTLSWTYFNPYVAAATTFPPPHEMRYGRVSEINRLLEMNNGHAIVFGGRQLGKSTIVQEVKRNFAKPKQKQYANYHLLDKNMDRMGISRDDWKNARKAVWEHIHSDLEKAGIVDKPDRKADADRLSYEVEMALQTNPDCKVIVIFDEIDPILNVDNAHDFGIFRGIRELVSKPGIQGRFKLIIAGLENVKRFENSPNYPLHQLGGSLQVSIMSTQDALHLIREPLFAAGYTFESAQVANRILSITNRHPGIIQVFCHELISYLANSKRSLVGSQVINDEDITNVHQKQEVIDLIRNRFDMTLNLDRRYLIIIYGLLSERKGAKVFSAKEAHEIAKVWLGDEFEHLGVKQFEAFLVELCGLGVLKAIKDGRTNQYVLRNYNILKLIGNDEDEINDKLEMAIRQHAQSSPLDRHAFWNVKIPACPITFRDEKELLGGEIAHDVHSEIEAVGSWKYSTTLIVGSEALGSKELEATLPRLYDSERLSHPELKSAKDYQLFSRSDTEFESPQKFEKILKGLLQNRSKENPVMLLVWVSGEREIAHSLGMLDAANNLRTVDMEKKYPVRVVFMMGPKAYWKWLENPLQTKGRDLTQPFINLAPWGSSAVAHFISKLGMGNAPADIEKLIDHTQGWYVSLDILRKISAENRSFRSVTHLPSSYVPMLDIDATQAKVFLKKSGIEDVSWAKPLIRSLIETWEGTAASYDEIQLTIQEAEYFDENFSNTKAVIDWMTALNVLRRSKGRRTKSEVKYQINPSIIHALDVENVE